MFIFYSGVIFTTTSAGAEPLSSNSGRNISFFTILEQPPPAYPAFSVADQAELPTYESLFTNTTNTQAINMPNEAEDQVTVSEQVTGPDEDVVNSNNSPRNSNNATANDASS